LFFIGALACVEEFDGLTSDESEHIPEAVSALAAEPTVEPELFVLPAEDALDSDVEDEDGEDAVADDPDLQLQASDVIPTIANGAIVSNEQQRQLGLVTVNGCSGTLLNRSWVLTARHCVTTDGALRVPQQITATWSSNIVRPSHVQGLSDARHDIALVYLGAGDFGAVNSQRLYTGNNGRLRTSDSVVQYGRGFSTFARAPSTPASGLGTYRSAQFAPSIISANGYTLAMNAQNQVGHGGDSGGPTVVMVNGANVGIAGVQSTCTPTGYVPGRPPTWDWATGISACQYASTERFVTEITNIINPFVSLPRSSWEAPPAGGSINLKVTTNQPSWTASSNASWLTVSPSSGVNGTVLTVKAATNTSTSPRSGRVTLRAGNASFTLDVTQAGASVRLSISTWAAPPAGGSINLPVTTNQPSWTASSNVSWVTVSPSSGVHGTVLVVSAATNTSTSPRTGTVTLRAGSASFTLTVTQVGASVRLPRSTWEAPPAGGTIILQVTINQPSWTARSNASWLTVSPSSGVNGTVLTVKAATNTSTSPRSGIVTLQAGDASFTLTVTQAGASVSLPRATWAAPPAGGSINLQVKTNQPSWTASSSNSSWLTVSPVSGVNGTVLVVSAAANTSTSARTGTVTLRAGNASFPLTVTQGPR